MESVLDATIITFIQSFSYRGENALVCLYSSQTITIILDPETGQKSVSGKHSSNALINSKDGIDCVIGCFESLLYIIYNRLIIPRIKVRNGGLTSSQSDLSRVNYPHAQDKTDTTSVGWFLSMCPHLAHINRQWLFLISQYLLQLQHGCSVSRLSRN